MADAPKNDSKTNGQLGLLREASAFEIGVVSLLILPGVLLVWIPILKEILPDQGYRTARPFVYLAIVVVYIIVVGIMWRGKKNAELEAQAQAKADELKRRLEIAKDIIYTSLVNKGHIRASFELLRTNLNRKEWNDE